MAFKKLPGNRGKIYVPDKKGAAGKFPCQDCFSCQWCSNERCKICRRGRCPIKPGEREAQEPEV